MSCSKIFSGDFPELIYEIIKYFQNDYSTLYSCILVNRLWCRLTIPLLWENPFSIPTENYNYNFIEIYSHNSYKFRTKLKEYRIINNLLPSNTLFNYLSYLKYLNTCKFITSIKKWFCTVIGISNPNELDIIGLIDICVSLFKIFIENEVNLHTLEIEVSHVIEESTHLNNILELIIQNPDFVRNIRNLKLYVVYNINISLIKDRISQIINSHQNLKKVFLGYNNLPIYQSLLLSEDYNCSNSLNTIILYRVNFKDLINLRNIFEQLYVLESVHIVYCSSLNAEFIQQIITLPKPFKLRSFFINEMSQIESLQMLLQKSGEYLENFGYGFEFVSLEKKHLLLELITKYCKNIKFLDMCGNDDQIVYSILNLIGNIKRNLNYLSISTCGLIWDDYYSSSYGNAECSSIILQNLGQTLPSELEYLYLSLHHIKVSDFEIFLENSQDTFIKKLVIHYKESQDILPSIKEYIMKKKRVRYLAISEPSFETSFYNFNLYGKELISLEDEVREFELYNIKVQSYYSSVINVFNFVKEIE
ncbi:uncharacterized protein OCT59_007908 [Rhizophagus irregularis]|uniref:F-box domain-containing protein n=3 Tax=Rhizophagus irregularis TaxID=588596 RepID=A0A015MRH2_RHIIW|nr:hypothetical protein GLOIN_2v1782302 [Rhizophagus irregularis DAOM 181602=DAOM 197198]EXX69368.1 hypothetical protein RirG_096880 [Rhizophagus irregularis DAOM 197198w]POG64948.1 hypothetical protein GLOIN_2v1782302 [Rhizophagus irregularis DAOM 181602=DAOM 197198]UZO16523.1 hypothetical protein OCT59_007908 [Rhizophagus irregularis]|eukprot:XP_025171814.1 hypothetical protein GLOIN_2v1782302 [Rhizophagus irregularis DAOM 181602=DAOM 197198]